MFVSLPLGPGRLVAFSQCIIELLSSFVLDDRDLYDTAPARTHKLPEDYLERVRRTHEEGGYGSIG